MGNKSRDRNEATRHLAIAINANLFTTFLITLGHVVPWVPASWAWVCAAITWAVLWVVLKFIVKAKWCGVKHIGFYFLPTMPFFWLISEHGARVRVEGMLEKILSIRPDAGLLMKIADPPHRQEGLREVYESMDKMNDCQLAEVVDEIRNCAEDILRGGANNANYKLLREIIAKLPQFKPQRYIQTWYHFLGLLSDIFSLCREGRLNGQVEEDMAFPLKDAMGQVDKLHLDSLKGIVSDIMADPDNKNALTIIIMGTLSAFEGNEKQEIRQFIFDEYKKRAIRYPQKSSHHFWRVVKEMQHRVFWLDIESLHNILVDPQSYSEHGIISLNRPAYSELCEGVFAPLEEVGEGESRHGRVFRRLDKELGEVRMECELAGGNLCNCDAKSLSLRGVYSGACSRREGEKLKAKIKIGEVTQSFKVMASVAKVHTNQHGDCVGGRGILFEVGNVPDVKRLFGYISRHPVTASS